MTKTAVKLHFNTSAAAGDGTAGLIKNETLFEVSYKFDHANLNHSFNITFLIDSIKESCVEDVDGLVVTLSFSPDSRELKAWFAIQNQMKENPAPIDQCMWFIKKGKTKYFRVLAKGSLY